MFAQFPKQRSVLPAEYQTVYAAHYKSSREGGSTVSSLAQRLETWLHRQVPGRRSVGEYRATEYSMRQQEKPFVYHPFSIPQFP
jgi:hypothetical protein